MLRSLYKYQREAFRYTRAVRHPALWMQMRLGKCIITIRTVHAYRPRGADGVLRALVVAPNSALAGWEDELTQEGANWTRLTGTRAQRLAALERVRRGEVGAKTWVLTNKETFLSVPEIAGRARCPRCRGRGWVRAGDVTRVVNRRAEPFDVDIGRGSQWGNPHRITGQRTREDVIRLYRDHLWGREDLLASLRTLWGQRLGCWCKPLACHGDVIVAAMDATLPRRKCVACRGAGSTRGFERDRVEWDAVILDESTFVKNPRARVAEFFLGNFRDVPHRWCLTGLPNPEGPLDLWCQLAWLDGRAFGSRSYWSFRAREFEEDEMSSWTPRPGAQQRIDRAVSARAYVLRREDVGIGPRKVRERRVVEMPAALRRAYRKAEREFLLEYDGVRRETMFAAVRWQWMRQMCGGFVDHELQWPGKLDAVSELLRTELAREPVVVWFAYNQELHAAVARLREASIRCDTVWGGVPVPEREARVAAWREGRTRVLLCQQAAADRGVHLAAADTAIYYSSRASGEMRQQTEDRIVDVQKTAPLLIVDMIARNTVDADVMDILTQKRAVSDRTLAAAVWERMMRRAG